MEKGAKDVYITATHGIFTGNATKLLQDKSIKEVIITNTIQLPEEKKFHHLKIISIGKVLAESINRIYEGEPMGVIFDGLYKKIEDHQ